MLNPITDKFIVEFSQNFFPGEITEDFDKYLFHLNGPLKSLQEHLLESIQTVTIPGLNLQIVTVGGLPNTGVNGTPGNQPPTTTIQFPGNAPLSEIYESNIITLNCRNTVINWMYFYKILRGYYDNKRSVSLFNIAITVMDAAEIPMMMFLFTDCFLTNMPGLEFSSNGSFGESKTIEAGFAFNRMDVKFILPQFKTIEIKM